MPVPLTYPGVYIEEIPSGVRTIIGVSTSVTAFVGFTPKGSVNKAVKIFNFGEFEREFGKLSKENELAYAVRQFFFNGGSEAWIVRVASGAVKASVTLQGLVNAQETDTLTITARSEGLWGNYLKLDVDYGTTNPDSTFNLTVYQYIPGETELTLSSTETFKNLSMDSRSPRYAVNVINAESKLVEASRPTVNLTLLKPGWSLSGELSTSTLLPLKSRERFISVIVDGDGPHVIDLFQNDSSPADRDSLLDGIQKGVRKINPTKFGGFTAKWANADATEISSGNHLLLTSGASGNDLEHSSVRVLNAPTSNASQALKLGLINGGREKEAAADLRPIPTGTAGRNLTNIQFPLNSQDITISLLKDTEGTPGSVIASIALNLTPTNSPVSSLDDLRSRLKEAIKPHLSDHPAFSDFTINQEGVHLRAVLSPEYANILLAFEGNLADALGFTGAIPPVTALPEPTMNIQKYSLGIGTDLAFQLPGDAGNDGTIPNASEITGDILNKTGIYALEDADIFNLLCIPIASNLEESQAISVISEAVRYCESKRAFMIVDPLKNVNTVPGVKEWMDKVTKSNYAALYFPAAMIADPADEFRLRAFPPSGTIAGLYARTDSSRGVWKAPAGIDASLNNVLAFSYNLTDGENGDLNKIGINCLRTFPVYGRLSWGARTLRGSDQFADEYKYIPVRRLALYIEESLFRGLKWVVFEPNDEPLWAQIRLNVGAFMQNLFRQGAFQGTTPREAYFVKCDKETTTQSDINNGIVNILVGFAPLKPAEFVVIKIQQMAGQIQT
jgi:phage tail sheath protein FI